MSKVKQALGTANKNTTSINKLDKRGKLPSIISLITGTEDESLAPSGVTVTADTINYKIGGRGWKITAASNVTNAYALMTFTAMTTRPAQASCMWVYVDDATLITNISLELQESSTLLWNRANTNTPAQVLVNGWNLLRWKLCEGIPATWTGTNISRVRVFLTTTAATFVTIGHVWLECPEKAKMIFILDRGYKTFVNYGGVARCRALGIPITWALDVALLGTGVDTTEVVTEADIARYAREGDSISFHGWDGSVTSSMTDAQYRTDTIKAIKWLQTRGYTGRMWRAANVQNLATASAILATKDFLLGNAQSAAHSVLLSTWPPINFNNIPRWNFYGRTTTLVDDQFALLKKTNSTMVVFNHGVQEAFANDATPAEFEYFFAWVARAISEGWLEPTTFEQLWSESGGSFSDVGASTVAKYTDVTGNIVTKTVL